MPIQSITLTNFRGFRYHTIALNDLSILVGHNNAGKSTAIDALRLLAVASEKSLTANFGLPPQWLRSRTAERGFTTTFNTVDFDFENVGYNQDQDEPAKLELRFKNKSTLILWLDTEGAGNFVQIRNGEGEYASNRAGARQCNLTPIYVMPPIQRVLADEKTLNPETVRESAYGRRAYRHFRNQLCRDPDSFPEWKRALEDSWYKLRIVELDVDQLHPERPIRLVVSDPPFVSEVAWVGSGLQSWMQIVWFLSRTPRQSSIILDEPDAYLHADLQRKLIKMLAELNFRQVTIATHSTEIISDVDPRAIVVVKKKNRYSSKPGQKESIQPVIDSLGSRHNVQLSKLAEARKVMVYEGDDQKFLSQVALKFGGNIYNSFMLVPYFDIAGVQNWREAIGAAKALAAATLNHVAAFLVIDRDFRPDKEIDNISRIAQQANLRFHCWGRKEIENYFVSPWIVAKYVSSRGNKVMAVDEARDLLNECAEGLVGGCLAAICDNYSYGDDLDKAVAQFASVRKGRDLYEVVGGKRLISSVSQRLQKSWGCQISAINLCRFAELEDLDDEITGLVRSLAGAH